MISLNLLGYNLYFSSSSKPAYSDWIPGKKLQLNWDSMAGRLSQGRLLVLCGDLCPIQPNRIIFHQ